MVKKNKAEPRDPHVREAYLAEGHKRYIAPVSTPISPTPIPNQPIAPIPIPAPNPIEQPSFLKEELLKINGIDEKIAIQLERLGINTIDDLAQASAKNIAKDLKIDLHTVQQWILEAKKLK